MENNEFVRAARLKLRFETPQGVLSVEELYDLSLTSLDAMARKVNKQLRDEGEESFLSTSTRKPCTNNSLRLDILKYIIETKETEQDAKKARAERAATLANLKDLAATKANEQLASKSLDEILKQINELEAQLA